MSDIDAKETHTIFDRLNMMRTLVPKITYGFEKYDFTLNNDRDIYELYLAEACLSFNILAIYNLAIDCLRIWHAYRTGDKNKVSITKLANEITDYYIDSTDPMKDNYLFMLCNIRYRNMLSHSYGIRSTIKLIIDDFSKNFNDFGQLVKAVESLCGDKYKNLTVGAVRLRL